MNDIAIWPLSQPPRHHFFGYYGINAWDRSQRYHLALESEFHDRPPLASDWAAAGLIDSQTRQFIPYGRTRAFNFQQGAMMFWLDVGLGEEFTYNDWEGEQLVSRVVQLGSRRVRTIPAALEAVSPGRPQAVCLNFARNYHCRSVVGYANDAFPGGIDPYPADEGLVLVDLVSGQTRLLLSIAQLVAADPSPQKNDGPAWFDHVYFNPSGTRLMFLCRIRRKSGWHSSMWTINTDGTGLACQIPYGGWISHFTWTDDRKILVSTDRPGKAAFYTFTDNEGGFELFAEGHLTGHATFSPDGRWIVWDVGSNEREPTASLWMYDLQTRRKIAIGRFAYDPRFRDDIRCDLHPRWRPDGLAITFDSVHEGTRQVYLADVAKVVQSRA